MLKLPYLPQPPKKARANLYIYSNDRIEIRSKETGMDYGHMKTKSLILSGPNSIPNPK